MEYIEKLLIISSYLTITQATNLNGDPTDLTNYPTCAVRLAPSYPKPFVSRANLSPSKTAFP